MKDLMNKIAVITGAAGGIGKALAEKSITLGMRAILIDNDEALLRTTAEELRSRGFDVRWYVADVTDPRRLEDVRDDVRTQYGHVHLLINNAGIGGGSSVWDTSESDWQRVFAVNVLGTVNMIRVFMPLMREVPDETHIVNVASIAAFNPGPAMGAYKASKSAIISISETLMAELAERNIPIRVTILCPSWVRTRILKGFIDDNLHEDDYCKRSHRDAQTLEHDIAIWRALQKGKSPESIAEMAFEALNANQPYAIDTYAEGIVDVTAPYFTNVAERWLRVRQDVFHGSFGATGSVS